MHEPTLLRLVIAYKDHSMNDLNSALFNIDIAGFRQPEVGDLLVAEPFLREQYFNHAVICLVDYEPSSTAMGIVLNNLTDHTLQELLPGVTVAKPIPVFCGGPLSSDRLFFMHTLGDLIPDSRRICDKLYIGGDFNTLLSVVNDGYPIEGNFRFFVGYSGWDISQLEDEIAHNVWAIASPRDGENLLEGQNDSYWHRIVRSMGSSYRGWLFHPSNPSVN